MADVPAMTLNNGVEIPRMGFGVFRIPGDGTVPAVLSGIEAGYRGIDTASLYGNETAVGTAVARCGLPREQLFITTKLWNDDQGYESTFRAFEASLAGGLDYVDLYLIHWPVPANSAYLETWKAFEEIFASGRPGRLACRTFSRGICDPSSTSTRSCRLNQVELHPRFQQEQMRAFDRAHGIVTEAWSPLAQGDILADPMITALSRRYGKTPAQIVLRWHIELGNVVIPKSVTPSRIKRTSTSSTSRSPPTTWPRSVRSTVAREPALTPTAARGRLVSRVLVVAGCLGQVRVQPRLAGSCGGDERSALCRQLCLRWDRSPAHLPGSGPKWYPRSRPGCFRTVG